MPSILAFLKKVNGDFATNENALPNPITADVVILIALKTAPNAVERSHLLRNHHSLSLKMQEWKAQRQTKF